MLQQGRAVSRELLWEGLSGVAPHHVVEVLAVTGVIQCPGYSLLVGSGTEKPFAFPSPSAEPH